MIRRALPFIILAILAPSAAAQESSYVAARIQLKVSDDEVLTGQAWRVTGRLIPARRASRVTVHVRFGNREVITRRLSTKHRGRFATTVRLTRPGTATVIAEHTATPKLSAAVSDPVSVRIQPLGTTQSDCRSTATVLSNDAGHPASSGAEPLSKGVILSPGADLQIPESGKLRLERDGARYLLERGTGELECHDIQVRSGLIFAATAERPAQARAAGVQVNLDPHSKALLATAPAQVRVAAGTALTSSISAPASAVNMTEGDTVLVDHGRPRMSTWPFAPSPDQHTVEPGHGVPEYWTGAGACAFGCRPPGVIRGWPLRPFHEQHPLRSGLNERRPANAHNGIDIQAYGNQKVYAMQSGTAHISEIGTSDQHISVGSYEYWHINHAVAEGQYVHAYKTVLGTLVDGARHVHISELPGYRNPLRPGAIPFKPYTDTEPPVIGPIQGSSVEVFDPQSFRRTIYYRTPVLAPAAVAWRSLDAGGTPTGAFHFVYRGTVHYGSSGFYAPGTEQPYSPNHQVFGWGCFGNWTVCIPHWRYPIAPGSAVYAWDWIGNISTRYPTATPST